MSINLGPIEDFNSGLQKQTLSGAITNIVTVITIFAGLGFLVWFVVGALTWITSADQAEKLNRAKNQMSAAIIGLVVVIITVPLVQVIGKILGIDILNPMAVLQTLKAR
jgi:arginine exporter protein ArgO